MAYFKSIVADGKSKLLVKNQSVSDIVNGLMLAQKNSRKHYPELRRICYHKDLDKNLDNIWRFVKKNVEYIKEPASDQTAKTVARILDDGYGDCKHYATMMVACMLACDIPCFFRLAGYKYNNSLTHIYAVADVEPIEIMDGVMKFRGIEAPYKRKVDIKIK